MKYCSSCGEQIMDEARFCPLCGKEIGGMPNKAERKVSYEGEVHKCPACGEPLRSFESTCPACGHELRGVKNCSSVGSLAEKLEKATTEKQRILIIKNFPIPNTREDIFEFMLLASSNFDASYHVAHLYEEDISDAWLTKIEQCYLKANLSFGDHPDFHRVENAYLRIKADCAEKEQKLAKEEKARISALERTETAQGFKKSKLRIVIIVFAVFSALCVAVSFNDGKILSGIIAILMFASFVIAFLMGSGVIKEKVKNMRLIPLILALVLFIPYFTALSRGDSIRWDDILLNEYVPKPILRSAEVMSNSREGFYIYDISCSQNEFYDYVEECKEFGYDHIIVEEDENSFEAYNEDGYRINLFYISTLRVELDAP